MADIQGSASSGTLRTIFLDRDGVLNEKMPEGRYVTAWTEFRLLPGVPRAVASLNQAGLRVIVVSNQRGISLGLYSSADVESIHTRLLDELKAHGASIDAFYFCPHDKQVCECRKPLPGMFDQARQDFSDIEPETSLMIGDSLSDVEFGKRVGMRTVFIQGDPTLRKAGTEKAASLADATFASLPETVDALLLNS